MQNNQAGQILDIFSTAEIEKFNFALSKLKNSPNQRGPIRAYTNGFEIKDLGCRSRNQPECYLN